MKHRILYEYSYPNAHVMIWRNSSGRVMVLVEDGESVLLDTADEGFELNDESAANIATVMTLIFDKSNEGDEG